MKRIIIVIYGLISLFTVYASPLYLEEQFIHTDEYATVCIFNDRIDFTSYSEKGQLHQENKYNYFLGDKTNYIILDCQVLNTYFLYVIKNIEKRTHLYGSWEMTFSKTKKEAPYNSSKLVPFTVQNVESFITESDKNGNEICFRPDDYFSLTRNPWAVKESYKEKRIHLTTKRWRNTIDSYYPIGDIVFVNGFVFPDKEYLYEQNSRAKKIRISYEKTSFEIDLQDTGNFQVIHLPKTIDPTANNDIIIEILDFYKGTMYSDIVISGIYYMDAIVK